MCSSNIPSVQTLIPSRRLEPINKPPNTSVRMSHGFRRIRLEADARSHSCSKQLYKFMNAGRLVCATKFHPNQLLGQLRPELSRRNRTPHRSHPSAGMFAQL